MLRRVYCLTLWQPWAWLVEIGAKAYETRSWRTSYRGPFVVHAAKTIPDEARQAVRENPHILDELGRYGFGLDDLPRGVPVALAQLSSVTRCDSVEDPRVRKGLEREFGNWAPYRYAWHLERVAPLEERAPFRGLPGFYEHKAPTLGLRRELEAFRLGRPLNEHEEKRIANLHFDPPPAPALPASIPKQRELL